MSEVSTTDAIENWENTDRSIGNYFASARQQLPDKNNLMTLMEDYSFCLAALVNINASLGGKMVAVIQGVINNGDDETRQVVKEFMDSFATPDLKTSLEINKEIIGSWVKLRTAVEATIREQLTQTLQSKTTETYVAQEEEKLKQRIAKTQVTDSAKLRIGALRARGTVFGITAFMTLVAGFVEGGWLLTIGFVALGFSIFYFMKAGEIKRSLEKQEEQQNTSLHTFIPSTLDTLP